MISTELNYLKRADNTGKLRVVADYTPMQGLNWKSFSWRSVRFWTQLPANIRTMSSVMKFKSHLKTWIMENVDINP